MRRSKFLSMTVFLAAVLLVSAGPAIAGPPSSPGDNGWSVKVTGGGDALAGGTAFSLTMSATDDSGQFQYARDGLVMHGTINCTFVAEDESYAVMSGVVTHAPVPAPGFVEGAEVSIAVQEGGNGAGDAVRIWPSSLCGEYGGGFPGSYYDGNINIRTR